MPKMVASQFNHLLFWGQYAKWTDDNGTERYICAVCGRLFDKLTSDEDALAELHEQFGKDIAIEDCDIVCDACWQKVRPDNPLNKKIFEDWLANEGSQQ